MLLSCFILKADPVRINKESNWYLLIANFLSFHISTGECIFHITMNLSILNVQSTHLLTTSHCGAWLLVKYYYSEENIFTLQLPMPKPALTVCICVECVLTMCLVAVCQQLVKFVSVG